MDGTVEESPNKRKEKQQRRPDRVTGGALWLLDERSDQQPVEAGWRHDGYTLKCADGVRMESFVETSAPTPTPDKGAV